MLLVPPSNTSERSCLFFQEHALIAGGCAPVVGVDEAGRGPLAGPVVAAAVSLGPGLFPLLADSKKLTSRKRDLAAACIKEHAAHVGIGIVDPGDIDRINIHQATMLAMRRALEDAVVSPGMVLVDGYPISGIDLPQRHVIKGDARCACIAAASIIAKTTRDRIMEELHVQYPAYGFARHKGYGTKAHYAALAVQGPCPAHRRSFKLFREGIAPDQQLTLWE